MRARALLLAGLLVAAPPVVDLGAGANASADPNASASAGASANPNASGSAGASAGAGGGVRANAAAGSSYFCVKAWRLSGDSLYLSGARYHGVFRMPIRGPDGPTYKRALKFTVKSVRIKNMVQTTGTITMRGRPGATTTVTANDDGPGEITMYTERLKGKLLGVPVEFSPKLPPPVTPPVMLITDVEVDNSALLNGDLTIPGAHLTVSGKG